MKLIAEKKLPEPVTQDVVELQPAKGPIGKVRFHCSTTV